MKKMLIFAPVILIICFIAVRILNPPHPAEWYDLSYEMNRNEVVNLINIKELIPVKAFDQTQLVEIWRKDYFCGQWFIKCTYNKNLMLRNAFVYYKCKVLPFKRGRHYPQPP